MHFLAERQPSRSVERPAGFHYLVSFSRPNPFDRLRTSPAGRCITIPKDPLAQVLYFIWIDLQLPVSDWATELNSALGNLDINYPVGSETKRHLIKSEAPEGQRGEHDEQ